MDFTQFTTYIELTGAALVGGLAVFGVFNATQRARRIEDESVATNLINNLRATTELQEKEITTLRAKEVEQGKEIAHLQGQMKVLTEILQGRDPDMKAHMELAQQNAQMLAGLARTMETFIAKLEPHITK